MLVFLQHIIRAEIALELLEFLIFDTVNLHQVLNSLEPS